MIRTLLLCMLVACATEDDLETPQDIAAQDDFLATITPDVSGEDATFDAGDDGVDPETPQPIALAANRYENPLRDGAGNPLTCPDPMVIDSPHGGYRYFLICTSDHDYNSFPIRKSNDLVHWQNVGYVFPAGVHPAWARRPIDGGRYWAPELYRIAGKWVVYFATNLPSGEMVIGVATSTTLRGSWSSHILHKSGEFNHVNIGHDDEYHGGVIDPSVQRGADGQLYLYYAKQSNQIWGGRLSADGLHLQSDIKFLFGVDYAWERDHDGHGVTEGPEPYRVGGTYYLMYSAASTWDGSYAIGVATSNGPLGPFTKKPQPILRSGRGFIAPGHSSHPVRGPDGNLYLLYHALRTPSHTSNDRKLMLDRFDVVGGWPLVNDGEPSNQVHATP